MKILHICMLFFVRFFVTICELRAKIGLTWRNEMLHLRMFVWFLITILEFRCKIGFTWRGKLLHLRVFRFVYIVFIVSS